MIGLISILLQTFPTDFTQVEANVLPLAFAALLVDIGVIIVWYFSGVVLSNDAVKESAKGEYYQFLGTALLIIVVIWGLTTYSSLSYTILGSTTLLSPSAMSTMCTGIQSNSLFNMIGGTNSLLSGATSSGGQQLVGICSMLSGSTITDKINYPLAATAVITANLTNQDANNLNAAFIFDSYMGFLRSLSPTISLCFAVPPEATQCWIPGAAILSDYFRVTLTYAPYAGYNMLYQSLGTLGTLLSTSIQSFIAQLLVISIILYIWPWLLFGGIVLRCTFFTRKLGGLLIAIAIGAVAIYPTMFGLEYLTLGNGLGGSVTAGSANTVNSLYGFNSLTAIPNNAVAGSNSLYSINFFVMPNLQTIAQANGCWPTINTAGAVASLLNPASAILTLVNSNANDPLATAEFADIFYLLNPLTNIGSGIFQMVSAIGTNTPSFFLPAYCPPTGAITTTFEMLDAYGIIGVTAYFMPIINLIITLSGIIGLSGVMGGNTTLEGLSRFV